MRSDIKRGSYYFSMLAKDANYDHWWGWAFNACCWLATVSHGHTLRGGEFSVLALPPMSRPLSYKLHLKNPNVIILIKHYAWERSVVLLHCM